MKPPSALMAVIALTPFVFDAHAADEIAPMTWTERSDWINVKIAPYHAAGDGVADDTAALQAALTAASASGSTAATVYLPAGIYKITDTLTWRANGGTLIGDGRDTIIQWGGAAGGTMFWSDGATRTRYIGLVWQASPDGTPTDSNRAAIGVDHHSSTYYESRIRHENEAFYNFSTAGIHSYGGGGTPRPTAETMVWNCLFKNCDRGIWNGSHSYNSYQWIIEGSEFQDCGTAIASPRGKNVIFNTRFVNSTVADISTSAGIAQRIRRCTSSGSRVFFNVVWGTATGSQVVEDCHIDSWTNVNGAITLGVLGPALITDCVFTNPPNSNPPISMTNGYAPSRLTVAGNYCPQISNLVSASVNCTVVTLSCGSYGSNLPTADVDFLRDTWPADSVHILDVTLPPYSAVKNNLAVDSTSAIQQAIDDAKAANNGSIVYIPRGRYRIQSTLSVTGGNYTIQGSGWHSKLMWFGAAGGTMMSVVSPQDISLEQFDLLQNGGNPTASPPVPADSTTVAIRVTATGPSVLVIDGIWNLEFPDNNMGAQRANNNLPGTVLENLPSGTLVYLEHLETPLIVKDSGRATILGKYSCGGRLEVNGATYAKTGFFGFIAFQGGQLHDPILWDLRVLDNQDLILGDWYQEQGYNHVHLSRGSGTGGGRVTIGGIKQHCYSKPVIQIDNYAGRFMYIGQAFSGATVAHPVIQSGSNPVDLILASCTWSNTLPDVSFGSGGNLIQLQNISSDGAGNRTYIPDVTPTDWEKSVSEGFDHFRQLAWYDLMLHYGIANFLGNSSAEPDTPNPAPTSTLGHVPAQWAVTNSISAGGGVRNATTVSGGSPFGPGSQSILFTDTTGSSSGSRLQLAQSISPFIPFADQGAVLTFDFRLNASGVNSDVWIRTFAATGTGSSIHLTGNPTSGHLSAVGMSASVQPGTWYRVQIAIPSPASGPVNATLYLTPWTGSGPGATTSYTIPSFGTPQVSGFTRIFINQVNPGQSTSINFDNIRLVTGDPLL